MRSDALCPRLVFSSSLPPFLPISTDSTLIVTPITTRCLYLDLSTDMEAFTIAVYRYRGGSTN